MKCLILCVALASFVASVVCETPPWEICEVDGQKPMFTPKAVDLNPIYIRRNDNVVFKIDGENSAHVVTGGTFEVHVIDVFTIHLPWETTHEEQEVYSESKDLCERAACPIPVGDVSFSYIKHMPSITPPGTYHIKLIARETGTDDLLMCLTVKIKIHLYKGRKSMTYIS